MAIAERLASWGSWGPRVAAVWPRVQGAVIEPHDREYEQARAVWNRAIDRRQDKYFVRGQIELDSRQVAR